jgi:hypothetical protein
MPVVFGLVAILALGLSFGPLLVGHVRHAQNPRLFNDDARQQIVPLFRHTENSPPLKNIPVGFKLLYRTFAPVVDPDPLSKFSRTSSS